MLDHPLSVSTNAAYVIVAAAGAWLYPSVETAVVGACLVALAAGSVYGHVLRTRTAWAQDVEAMYLATGSLVGLAWTPHLDGALAVGVTAGAVLAIGREWLNMFVVMGGLVALGVVAFPPLEAIGLGGGFVLAVVARTLGVRMHPPWSDRFHAMWHVFVAADMFTLIMLVHV